MLTVALPKGRIADETLEIFSEIFKTSFVFEDRKLIMQKGGFKFLSVRNQDIPTYVINAGADIGVVGLDTLEEHSSDVLKLLDLGIAKCKVCVGVRKGEKLNYQIPSIKIATKMPNITRRYFAKKAVSVDAIKLYGSIELAPILGIADAIVDNVETGATMRQNGLEVAEVIFESSAFLIANKNSFIVNRAEILDLCDKIESVLQM
ncbi:MAG: ATP phosphoribosyltransferase [Campylobacter sp.]|nr:ATP phosphoribosyltransferase [Campylobacter sp.]